MAKSKQTRQTRTQGTKQTRQPPETVDEVLYKPQKPRPNEASLQSVMFFEARLRHLEERDQQQLLALLEKPGWKVADGTDALTQHLASVADQASYRSAKLQQQGYDQMAANEVAMSEIVAPSMQDAPQIPALSQRRLDALVKKYRQAIPDQKPLYPRPHYL